MKDVTLPEDLFEQPGELQLNYHHGKSDGRLSTTLYLTFELATDGA
jgi:hypothetical protein